MQAPVPVIALVGYTNAGKSTLLNKVTEASVLAEDKLFATLDPTTRRVSLPSNKEVCTALLTCQRNTDRLQWFHSWLWFPFPSKRTWRASFAVKAVA